MPFKFSRPDAGTLLVTSCVRARLRSRRCDVNAFATEKTILLNSYEFVTKRLTFYTLQVLLDVRPNVIMNSSCNDRMIIDLLVYIVCLDVAIQRVKDFIIVRVIRAFVI